MKNNIEQLTSHATAIRAELKNILSDEWHIQQYNDFASHYNQSPTGIKAEQEFENRSNSWNQRASKLSRKIKTESGLLPSWYFERLLSVEGDTLSEDTVKKLFRLGNSLSDDNFVLLKSTLNQCLQCFRLRYKERLINTVIEIVMILDYSDKLSLWDELTDSQKAQMQPHNYAGELTQECVAKVRELRKKHSRMGINKFFPMAHKKYECCQYTFKNNEKEKISWQTLRNRIKVADPDTYYGNF